MVHIHTNAVSILHFVSDEKQLSRLMAGACARVKTSLRPKTRRCYELLFRNFVDFCICLKKSLHDVNVGVVLAYLEYLVKNNVSVHMVSNNISSIRASLIMYGLDYLYLDHPCVRYFVKALKINRPLAVVRRNVMSLETLKHLTLLCDEIQFGFVFKPVFLIAFFGFLRISNLARHSVSAFDPFRNMTIADITFHSQSMQITIKWSKTLQYRDKVHIITLPKLKHSPLCPVKALKTAIKAYNPTPSESLFQVPSAGVWQPSGAQELPLHKMSIQSIKHHGSWASDCVWTYIQQDNSHSAHIASSFASLVHSQPWCLGTGEVSPSVP